MSSDDDWSADCWRRRFSFPALATRADVRSSTPQALHRTLGALARGVGLIDPRPYQPGSGARRGSKKDELDELLSDLARLLE